MGKVKRMPAAQTLRTHSASNGLASYSFKRLKAVAGSVTSTKVRDSFRRSVSPPGEGVKLLIIHTGI